MMPIKIECECGQHYAFDVEPLNGRMPSTVACPHCGADGTVAANQSITRQLAPGASTTETPPSPPARLALAVSSAPPAAHPAKARRPDPRLGLVDRTQAEHEARAKAMWGDSSEQVISYLMIQGFSASEAKELAAKLFKERASAVRGIGIRKIIIGIGLMFVPVGALFVFLVIGIFLLKVLGAAVLVGLYGVWLVINGILMAVAPKSEKGDVAGQ